MDQMCRLLYFHYAALKSVTCFVKRHQRGNVKCSYLLREQCQKVSEMQLLCWCKKNRKICEKHENIHFVIIILSHLVPLFQSKTKMHVFFPQRSKYFPVFC